MCIFFFFGKMLFFDRIMIIVVDCSINGHKFFLVYHSAMSLSSSFHESVSPSLESGCDLLWAVGLLRSGFLSLLKTLGPPHAQGWAGLPGSQD